VVVLCSSLVNLVDACSEQTLLKIAGVEVDRSNDQAGTRRCLAVSFTRLAVSSTHLAGIGGAFVNERRFCK
jgi:hypothetical protein